MQLKKVISQKMRTHLPMVIAALGILFLVSCKNDAKLPQQEAQGLPEDFVKFYNKFHNDSVYQMAHIEFPLEGFPSGNLKDSTQNGEDFHWTADKWLMHRLAFFNGELFTRTFESPMPIVVNEIIIEKQNGYGTLRRFLKRGDEWHLIFYSDMNRLENKQPVQKPELKIE